MAGFLPYVPATFGVAAAIVAMVFDAWGSRVAAVAGAAVLLVAGAAAAAWSAVATPSVGDLVSSGATFSVAPAVCLVLTAAALIACGGSLSEDRTGSRVVALGALAGACSALVAAAVDVGVLFLGIEALALCGYGMVALGGTDRAREAAMKWFIQGSVATAVLIIGIAVIVGRTGGALGYSTIAAAVANSLDGPMAVGFVLVLAALAFKLGAFPMHSWMPDAYETAPTAASAVMASAGKVGPLVATVWLAMAFGGATGSNVVRVVAVVSVCSIVFGNLAALRQKSLARLLAYSGIAQVGYALVGVLLGAQSATVLVFAFLYGVTALAAFVSVEAIRRSDPGWDGSVAGLAGLSKRHPMLAASLATAMFSLTGMPLTAGFWGKFLVFGGAAVGGYLWLAIVGVLGSVVSFGYYGGVIRAAYIDEPADPEQDEGGEPAPGSGWRIAAGASGVLAVLIVVAGVVPIPWGVTPILAALIR